MTKQIKLPSTIIFEDNRAVEFSKYCKEKSEEATARFGKKDYSFTPEAIKELAELCNHPEAELNPDAPHCVDVIAEEVCIDVERSRELEEKLGSVPPEVTEPVATNEVTEVPAEVVSGIDFGNQEGDQPFETVIVPENLETSITEEPQPAPDATVELEVVEPENTQDLEIVEAAKSATIKSLTSLEDRFDFGPDGTQFQLKKGAIASPSDYATILGAGYQMSVKGMWLVGGAINQLSVLGHSVALDQIAADLRMSYSTISNWNRVCQRISPEKRIGLPPTVAQEIAASRFVQDKEENQKIIDELVDRAREEKWSASEARSFVSMTKEENGRPKQERKVSSPNSEQLQAIKEAYSMLKLLLEEEPNTVIWKDAELWVHKYGKLVEQ